MNNKNQKLELTWIGKGEEPKLEPRILLEQPEYSYGDPDSGNMLIHGDNLLALKALEQDFAGKVKCIYIDPPFNTGSAFEHYDDGVEHSIWLELMSHRLRILQKLLSEDGAIFVHIDYNEEAYLRVLMDEVFGRGNFRNTIVVARIKKNVKERDKVRALNYAHDTIVFYSKSSTGMIVPPFKESKKEDRWHNFEAAGIRNGMDYDLFGFKPKAGNHWRWSPDRAQRAIQDGILRPNPRSGKPEYLIPASNFEVMDTNWLDLIASAFNWNFPNGEKNEKLIARIFEMITSPGDIIMDSFLGSGTTAAVAHKMGRRWIGVELGEHAKTHCCPRLKAVVDGEQGGISKAVNWNGGGGYRFYTLAPSLLNKDKYGNWVISKEYNPAMLAAAMAKQEGFRYMPDEHIYWKQGKSSEKDFIFTTTQFITVEMLDGIHDEMKPGETLLIACKSFQSQCANRYPSQITIKQIPQILYGKCEFGNDDYSLNIVNVPGEYQKASPDINYYEEDVFENNQTNLFGEKL